MNHINVLNEMNLKLKKYSDKNDIEYRIINNTFGKNLILIKLISSNLTSEDLIKNMKKYENYIQEIIIEEDEDDFFIKEIKKICKKNSFVHSNISYKSWNKNQTQIESIDKNKVVIGYSFKGGMGRSQSLAYLSLFMALTGKKVVVLDCDFEAPGIGSILKKDLTAPSIPGIIDYLIDLNSQETPQIKQYCFSNESVENLMIFSSGIEYNPEEYIHRLSKIDFNSEKFLMDFTTMIRNIQNTIKPDYIFIDLRAGINESNGYILHNFSNRNLLFFNNDTQNLLGLQIILNQLFKNEDNYKHYYLVNSLIRDYNLSSAEYKKDNFKNYVNSNFGNYKNKIYELHHESKFLTGSFSELYKLTTNNVTLYLERNAQNTDINETLIKLEKLIRNMNSKDNKKEYVELISLKNILGEKRKHVKNENNRVEKEYIDIFLEEILTLII